MPYTKEQLRTYWAVNKEALNAKRRERRRLAKEQVSQGVSCQKAEISSENKEVSQEVSSLKDRLAVVKEEKGSLKRWKATSKEKVSQTDSPVIEQVSQLKTLKPPRVSHQKKVSQKTGKLMANLANPQLNLLFKQWLTFTNYACSPTCSYTYCNNCWFFEEGRLVDYKQTGLST